MPLHVPAGPDGGLHRGESCVTEGEHHHARSPGSGRGEEVLRRGLEADVEQDFPSFVKLDLGEGTSPLALYEWDAAAKDAGVSSEGSGFRGVSFHFTTDTREEVDEVIAKAAAAGGRVVRKPESAQWGGYFGYFADPDGYLWKVATAG